MRAVRHSDPELDIVRISAGYRQRPACAGAIPVVGMDDLEPFLAEKFVARTLHRRRTLAHMIETAVGCAVQVVPGSASTISRCRASLSCSAAAESRTSVTKASRSALRERLPADIPNGRHVRETPRSFGYATLRDMNGEPTQRELYDATLLGFITLESRIHEFDEDFQSFRIEVNRRFDTLVRLVTPTE
jgi:hypothetical protein